MIQPNPDAYLHACDVIDCDDPAIKACAAKLKHDTLESTVGECFRFVRDEIFHSKDHQQNPVTYRASDVLAHRTGYCYAKSHLLAALLRVNGVPAGLCYQRLTIDGEAGPFSLHGLNAVFLTDRGWYRIDPRGNREGIDAQFDPPHERLAFPIQRPGEIDFPGIYVRPLPIVGRCLTMHKTWDAVARSLPDLTDLPNP
ncbi:MAG: transglutaminase family protein [Pirellulaceae bacterium]